MYEYVGVCVCVKFTSTMCAFGSVVRTCVTCSYSSQKYACVCESLCVCVYNIYVLCLFILFPKVYFCFYYLFNISTHFLILNFPLSTYVFISFFLRFLYVYFIIVYVIQSLTSAFQRPSCRDVTLLLRTWVRKAREGGGKGGGGRRARGWRGKEEEVGKGEGIRRVREREVKRVIGWVRWGGVEGGGGGMEDEGKERLKGYGW